MRLVLLVGIGGFFGSICRYLMQLWFSKTFVISFPTGTFAVNIIGCFLVRLVYGFADRGNVITTEMRIFLATGFCGGFTTFSAFSYGNISLLRQGDIAAFMFYSILSVGLGFLAVALAIYLTR